MQELKEHVLSLVPRKKIDWLIERLSQLLPACSIAYTDHEKRSEKRFVVATEVAITPLDQNFQPMEAPFMAVTRDLTNHGIGLLLPRAVDAPFLAVEFTSGIVGDVQLVSKVLRCKRQGNYYDVGGTFVTGIMN